MSDRSPFLTSTRVFLKGSSLFSLSKRTVEIESQGKRVVLGMECEVDLQSMAPFILESSRFVSLLDSYDISNLFLLSARVMGRCQSHPVLSRRFSNITVYTALFARESAEQIARSTRIPQVRDYWNTIYPSTPVPCLFGYSAEGFLERRE